MTHVDWRLKDRELAEQLKKLCPDIDEQINNVMNSFGEKRLITVGIFRKTPYRSFIVNSLDFLPDEVEKVKTKNEKNKK